MFLEKTSMRLRKTEKSSMNKQERAIYEREKAIRASQKEIVLNCLEEILRESPDKYKVNSIIARKTGVPAHIVGEIVVAHRRGREQSKDAQFVRQACGLAMAAKCQRSYAGPREGNKHKWQLYWLKLDAVCAEIGIAYTGSSRRSVVSAVAPYAGALLDKIAENVFSAAYAEDAIRRFQDKPNNYIAFVADNANTLPATARYFLEKKFRLPPTKKIIGVAREFGMPACLAAEAIRCLNEN